MTGPAPAAPAAHRLPAALDWLVLAAGLGAAIGWVLFAQHLGETITVKDPAGAMALYYALLFVPLVALAIGLGALGGRPALRIGAAPARWLAVGGAMGLFGFLATLGLSLLNGGLVRNPEGVAGAGAMLALGVLLTLGQVFAEEVLFRGWLQPALVDRVGAIGGVLLGAVFFAGFHLSAGVHAPVSLVNLVLGGIFFGLLALRSGGLAAPVAAHFAWNVVEDLGFGLVPNPGAGALGSLWDFDLLGSPLWGGHEEGLNASIGTCFVLLALILPLLRAPASRGAARETPAATAA